MAGRSAVVAAVVLAYSAAAPAEARAPVRGTAASPAWPGCDAFAARPAAQRAWESGGRPAAADGDGDGRVCEALPEEPERGGRCMRTRDVVEVRLSRARYPNVLAHAERAARRGWPSVYVITRRRADDRRDRLLRDIATRPGYDRDEVPPAIGRGRGKGLARGRAPRGWRADVEYVPSGENRGAGSVMGARLRPYCGRTRFTFVGY